VDDLSLEGDLETTGLAVSDVALRQGIAVAPNPSGGAVRIEFTLKAEAPAWVTVFDAAGRRVRSLVEEVLLPTGTRSVSWDGRDDSGRAVASGIYWARVYSGGRTSFASFVLFAGR
jgi:flagellar hook assembly protein FlgD